MLRALFVGGLVAIWPAGGLLADVVGRVAMPETCSPTVSPAVVVLEPRDGRAPTASAEAGTVALVRQSGLTFQPRVLAVPVGRPLVLTNEDSETHSVHNMCDGPHFNINMRPGQRSEVVPTGPGVLKLVCDVHSHMRAFVVVGKSPWVATCDREGRFRLREVADGRYLLRVWHEMGDELRKEVEVKDGKADLGTLTVTAEAVERQLLVRGSVRPWSEVIDRIGLTLAASLDAAQQPGGQKRAQKLADDAYWGEFEASGMETAARSYLGFERTGAIERELLAIRPAVRDVALGKRRPAIVADLQRRAMADLVLAAGDLNRKGITDASKVDLSRPSPRSDPPQSGGARRASRPALDAALDSVLTFADGGDSDEAASAMSDAYLAFEPMEAEIAVVPPLAVDRLEARFNALRGEVGVGLKGEALAGRLAALRSEVEAAASQVDSSGAGTFGAAFAASLVTILREGVEVILLLTMLLALVAKTGRARELASAIGIGVALAVAASVLTAIGLNWMVAAARGTTRELLEGLVLLGAAGLLFYVSYWLISQMQAKRWADFLKRQALQGAEHGSGWTLGLTAFFAVYREGAETALMYQGLYSGQSTELGRLGLAVGLGLGLVLLGGVYLAIRSASVRLPLRRFFQVSGLLLFVMAVVFAGKGVFELQNSGFIRITPLLWLGHGLPAMGLYPNLQALSVQGLLLAGAAAALLLLIVDDRPARQASTGAGA